MEEEKVDLGDLRNFIKHMGSNTAIQVRTESGIRDVADISVTRTRDSQTLVLHIAAAEEQ